MANKDTKFTIEVELAGDSKKIQQAIKDGLSKDFTAKVGADTNKLTRDINDALRDLNSSDKKVKIGVNGDFLLRDINKVITSINGGDSLKKLKLGVDANYLQQQLNKAVKGLDTTVKLKTKLETSSKTTNTKGTVTTNKTSKKEADEYQSLFSKRASAIQNMDKAYQEFGRDSKELRGAFKEFLSASREVRKFGKETGVLSLNKINSDLERLIGANMSNSFVKNALLKERDKVLRDRDELDRTLNPDKYARLDAKAKVKQLEAEHASVDAELKQRKQELAKAMAEATNYYKSLKAEKSDFAATRKQQADYYKQQRKEEEAQQRLFNLNEKNHAIFQRESAKTDLLTMSQSSKASGVFNEEQFANFKSRLEEYRGLIDNFNTNFYKKIGKELGITDESHPFYKELQKMYQDEKERDKAWDKKVSTTAIKSETAELEKQADIKQKISDVDAKLKSLRDNEVTQQKSVNTALKANYKAAVDREKEEKELLRVRKALNIELSKSNLLQLSQSAKADKRLDNDKMQRFMDELQNYRNLTGNYMSSFFTKTGRELGIKSDHPYFNAMRTLYQSNLRDEAEWRKKPLTANVEVKGTEKVEELNQKILTTTQQFMRLRGEALKAGNALNQATDPKEVARLTEEFKKAIQALVNYQRATRGLTKGGEAQLVEKLAVGNIKEQTEAYKVLVEWIKKAVQAQRDLDVTTGRKLPRRSKDTDFMSYLNNMDWGRAVSGMAYAARGELNTVQALGNFISSMSQLSGVVGSFAKFLGGLGVAVLAFTGVVNAAATAFSSLINVLSQVGRAVYDALKPGIELYKLRETAELSLAATLSNMATEEGRNISYERGLELSAGLVNRAFMDALKSAFNPEELIRAMQGTLGIAFAKGLNLDQAYNVVKSTAAVAKSIQLQPNQLLQEVRDILQGTLTAKSSQVAYAVGMNPESLREAQSVGAKIGLTDEGIQQAQEQGRLYEYIMEKMQTYNIALEKYADTFSGAMDRLTEAWALAGMKIFEKIAPGLNGVIDNIINDFILTIDENNMPQLSDNLKQVGDALSDIVAHLMSVIDAVIEFVKDLTGQEDTIGAIKALIIDMIDIAAFGFLYVLQCAEWLKEAAIGLYNIVQRISNLSGVLDAGVVFIEEFTAALIKLITLDFKGFIDKVESAQDRAAKNIQERWNEGIIDSTNISGRRGLGLFEQYRGKNRLAYEEGKLRYGDRTPKPYDATKIEAKAMADAAKQSLADQRKMIQAMIEDIKQALKQALQELKDIAEQNELAYRQGYKSIEDYFRQKAELEAEEARLKLEAAIAERDAIASLDTGGDAGAEYQKQRDLIKYNSEIATYSREYNKKAAQQVEVLQAIERTLQNKTFQQGIVAGGDGSAVGNKVVQEAIARLGKPTEYGGDGEVSFDCSSLTMKVNSEAGIEIPRTADEQKRQHDEMQTFHDLQEVLEGKYIPKPGDSVYFRAGDTEDSYDGVGHVELVKAFKDGILETISGGNYGVGVLEKERELGDYEMAGFGSVTELAQKLGVLNTEAKEATDEVNQVVGQMPQVFSTLADQYQQAVKQGQKQMIDVQKEYAKNLNDPELLKAISLGEVRADMLERIEVARKKYANIPAIADNLEKLLPLKEIDAIITSLSSNIEMKLKIMEHDAMAMNQNLREKTVLFPQAIRKYADAFFGESNEYGIGSQIKELTDKFTEYSKLGFIGKAQEVSNKIEELQNKFVSMVDSWITEMNSYFDYRRQLIDANSGLTSFVKEERKNQLDKGEARVKAVAYAEEAAYFAEQEAYWQGECNKLAEQGQKVEGSIAQQQMQKNEQLKQTAMRQAEINALLGEQKTLWQETMDAANQALENGLYNFMTDYINTAESIGEAFRNMAIDILKDLQKFFAKKAITDLMHVITGTPNEQYNAPNTAEVQTAYNTNAMVYWLQNIYTAIGSLQTAQTTSMFTNLGGSMVGGTYIPNTSPSFIPGAGQKRATGGYISGPGTSTSDSIHAMLSNGEYVIKADAVRKYGLNFLDAVNSGHFTRMRTVIPRFADGGYVGDALQDTARGMTDFAKNLGTSVGVDNTISIALVRDEQEAIREWAKSPSGGQKFLVDFAKGNGRVFSRFNR